jgi:hypothetical protein
MILLDLAPLPPGLFAVALWDLPTQKGMSLKLTEVGTASPFLKELARVTTDPRSPLLTEIKLNENSIPKGDKTYGEIIKLWRDIGTFGASLNNVVSALKRFLKRHDPARRHNVELFFGETLKAYTSKHLGHYLPSGIRCHAMRHIVATDYIMRDPINGYKLAAIALWESDATVFENYFHVEQEGLLRKHAERLEELRLACLP